ncbi:MAG: prepilin peptidase [Halanaerobiales bacterium]|nr:prepilin peptidase [Halanaerobiales bacterium]
MGSFVIIMGVLIGSFLNVCIYRLPRNESIIFPPSHCPHCQKRLKPIDLIPILSYIFYRGRCCYCHNSISIQYPLFEGLTGLIYFLTYLKFGLTTEGYFMLLFNSALLVVTGIDARHRIIPDSINLPGIVIGLIAAIFTIHISFLNSILGILVGGGIFFLIALITRGGIGGGDIKLMGFIGAFLGVKATLLGIFFGSLIGSIYGVYLIFIRKAGLKTTVPYGPFLATGAFIAALYGDDLVRLYLNWVLG